MLLTMPRFILQRSHMDPSIYYLQRQAASGNWSSKMAMRVHELSWTLPGQGFSPEQIEVAMSLKPGMDVAIDTI
jgi:hypothetical protein